ncbi:MAG: class I SAM-dependent methyltransferase [Acidobacteriota bacterium]
MVVCPRCEGELEGDHLVCQNCGFVARNGQRVDFHPRESADLYFDENEFSHRFEVEQKHYWHRARRGLLLRIIDAYAWPGARLLEVGCGCCHLSGDLARAGYDNWALDLSEAALQCGMKQGLRHLCKASVNSLPFREEFDVVCCFDVIEHLPDDLHAVRNLRCAVRAGGLVLIAVPAHPVLWSSWDRKQRHLRRYRRRDLEGLIRAGGMEVVSIQQLFTILYFPSLLAAIVDRAVGGDRRKPVSLDRHYAMWNPPVLSGVAHWLISAERYLLRRNVPRPGTTLLAVARRPN